MIDRKQIGKRLATERKRLGYSQAEFANLCSVSGASQFIYEKGDRTLTVDYLLKAREAGLDLNYLLSETNEIPSNSPASTQALRHIFVQTDIDCRDKNGNLMDLSLRADHFEALMENHKDALKKRNAS